MQILMIATCCAAVLTACRCIFDICRASNADAYGLGGAWPDRWHEDVRRGVLPESAVLHVHREPKRYGVTTTDADLAEALGITYQPREKA